MSFNTYLQKNIFQIQRSWAEGKHMMNETNLHIMMISYGLYSKLKQFILARPEFCFYNCINMEMKKGKQNTGSNFLVSNDI